MINAAEVNRLILQGDVMEKISEIESQSINCIITSFPYWALRDYEQDGQWGLEIDYREYLARLRGLMKELKRVLTLDGSCWINLGDTYAGGDAHSDWSQDESKPGSKIGYSKERAEKQGFKSKVKKNHFAAKSLYGIPERFYIQCIDDGWVARNFIPWIKPNAMPSSVDDRLTNIWERVFFFTKNSGNPILWRHKKKGVWFNEKPKINFFNNGEQGYHWEWVTTPTESTRTSLYNGFDYYFELDAIREQPLTTLNTPKKRISAIQGQQTFLGPGENKKQSKSVAIPGQAPHGISRNRIKGLKDYDNKQDQYVTLDGKPDTTKVGFNERWKYKAHPNEPPGNLSIKERMAYARKMEGKDHDGCLNNPKGRNPGDIFIINTRPFVEAHFATFPYDLPLKILKCSCPPDGIVLDPFFGAGTTAVAAEMIGRRWMGIELNPDYIKLAQKRLKPFKNEKLV